VCGTPGIGKAIGTTNKTMEEDFIETRRKSLFRNRLVSVFQLKRSKITSNHPFVFARPKVIKDVDNKQPKPETAPRIPTLEFQNHQKLSLRLMKSLPHQNCPYNMPSPCVVVSVGTQTDSFKVEHRNLRRVGAAETKQLVRGLSSSENRSNWEKQFEIMGHKKSDDTSDRAVTEAHSGDREESEAHIGDREVSEVQRGDREVSEALSRGSQALQEAIQYRQRANIYFNSTSDVMSPTTDIDSEDDMTDTDDSDVDDDSINIYEEALNCEEDTYVGYIRQHPCVERWTHQSYSVLPTNNKVVEKKKLNRAVKSNPPLGQLVQLDPQGLQEKQEQIQREEAIVSKYHGLKKSLSSKFSFFPTKKIYKF
jgi:hypothetical protein